MWTRIFFWHYCHSRSLQHPGLVANSSVGGPLGTRSTTEWGRPNPKDYYFSQTRQSSTCWFGEKRNQLFLQFPLPALPFFFSFLNQICSIMFSSLRTGNSTRGFLNGPNWGKEADWLGKKSTLVHIPLCRQAIEGPLGLQAAEDATSHKVFIFCGFVLASADSIFIESSPKTAGIRTCLATQGEISVPWGKKSYPFWPPLSSPLSHPPHVVTFFKCFPEFVHTEKESPVFLKSLIG